MSSNPIVHFEIGGSNVAETQQFLQDLFGWGFEDSASGPSVHFGMPDGLSAHLTNLGEEWGPYILFYVQVEDIDAMAQRTGDLGGKVLVGPVTLEGQGRFAWISLPEGQLMGLWETA
ncbi:MAG: VOC family protein [Pseudomonadota bacterium]